MYLEALRITWGSSRCHRKFLEAIRFTEMHLEDFRVILCPLGCYRKFL